MAVLKPFCAIRPKSDLAKDVVALPYDVMNREEAFQMASENSYSFLHICRSEIDLPQWMDAYAPEVYKKAKTNLDDFITKGIYIKDETPSLYLYKQVMEGRSQVGIVGCFSIDDYQNNIIKKHELTRVEKELDRINHFDYCNANTEPVFLTYKNDSHIQRLIHEYLSQNEPEFDITSKDHVRHALWRIGNTELIQSLVSSFAAIDSLYIADGHHRSASAVKVGLKRREENPNYSGEEEFNYFMAVLFPDSELKIYDYNRVVKDLNGHSTEEFLEKLSKDFLVERKGTDIYQPEGKHKFGMFLDGQWYQLQAKEQIVFQGDILKSLDVNILQDNVLSPILGIGDPRTDKRIDFIGGIRGPQELEARVNKDMAVAFYLYPVEIKDLIEISDQSLIMPPKSTWFEPKLGSGLFIHQL